MGRIHIETQVSSPLSDLLVKSPDDLRYIPAEVQIELIRNKISSGRNKPDVNPLYSGFQGEFNSDSNLFVIEEKLEQELYSLIDYLPSEERQKIKLAASVSLYGHQFHFRKSGEPYSIHPFWMAIEGAKNRNSSASIQARLLHDLPEDTLKNMKKRVAGKEVNFGEYPFPVTLEDIRILFGDEVSVIVNGLQKIDHETQTEEENDFQTDLTFYESFSGKEGTDYRVVLIKLDDRLHYWLTVGGIASPLARHHKAGETLAYYVDLAKKTGEFEKRDQLADFAFKEYLPEMYERVLEFQRRYMSEANLMRIHQLFSHVKGDLPEIQNIQFRNPCLYAQYSLWKDIIRGPRLFSEENIYTKVDIVVDDDSNLNAAQTRLLKWMQKVGLQATYQDIATLYNENLSVCRHAMTGLTINVKLFTRSNFDRKFAKLSDLDIVPHEGEDIASKRRYAEEKLGSLKEDYQNLASLERSDERAVRHQLDTYRFRMGEITVYLRRGDYLQPELLPNIRDGKLFAYIQDGLRNRLRRYKEEGYFGSYNTLSTKLREAGEAIFLKQLGIEMSKLPAVQELLKSTGYRKQDIMLDIGCGTLWVWEINDVIDYLTDFSKNYWFMDVNAVDTRYENIIRKLAKRFRIVIDGMYISDYSGKEASMRIIFRKTEEGSRYLYDFLKQLEEIPELVSKTDVPERFII